MLPTIIEEGENESDVEDTIQTIHHSVKPAPSQQAIDEAAVNIELEKAVSRETQVKAREERLERRNKIKEMSALSLVSYIMSNTQPGSSNETTPAVSSGGEIEESAYFVDLSTCVEEAYFFSYTKNTYIKIRKPTNTEWSELPEELKSVLCEEGYKAVTENVPKRFEDALRHRVLELLKELSGALVEVDQQIAKEEIKKGADCLLLFPVYEEKVKDGKVVYKVRLVAKLVVYEVRLWQVSYSCWFYIIYICSNS